MNMKLFKSHELFHKHDFKKIGSVPEPIKYNIFKCECGIFAGAYSLEVDDSCYNFYIPNGPLNWYRQLTDLLIKSNLLEKFFSYINFKINENKKHSVKVWGRLLKRGIRRVLKEKEYEHEII